MNAAEAAVAALSVAATPIGPHDVLNAGRTKAGELILVTNNAGEFRRVAGLRVEEWI